MDEQRRTAHSISFDSCLRAPGILTGQRSMVLIQISVKCEFELSHVKGLPARAERVRVEYFGVTAPQSSSVQKKAHPLLQQ